MQELWRQRLPAVPRVWGETSGWGKVKGDGNGLGKGAGFGDRPENENETNTYETQVRGKPKNGRAIIAGFADGPNRKGVSA